MLGLVSLLTIITGTAITAQTPPEPPLTPGLVLAPLDPSTTLCVISNMAEDEPQWFLLKTDGNTWFGSLEAAFNQIVAMKASTDGRFLAVLSVGEGHPLLEVIDLRKLLSEQQYTVLHEIDPYPGVIAIQEWQGNDLHVNCDMLLTRRDPKTGRVPSEWMLTASEVFAMNVLTGQISGISEGAKNPAQHYAKILLDQSANDTQKDQALANVLSLNAGDLPIAELMKMLEHEQDPKRILKILEEIEKLRGKTTK